MRHLTADPYMDGWLRDLDMAIRRFNTTSDMSGALHDLWILLETGYEIAEAVNGLTGLTAEASSVLGTGR